MEQPTILPCPCCGSEAKIIQHDFDENVVAVVCTNCRIQTRDYYLKNKEEAIVAWNKRHKEECYMNEIKNLIDGLFEEMSKTFYDAMKKFILLNNQEDKK